MNPELQQYLKEMEARLSEQLDKLETRIQTGLEAGRIHTSEVCENVETKLLTEFHKWGRTSDMRTRDALTHAAALAERVLAVEDRVAALERKPAA